MVDHTQPLPDTANSKSRNYRSYNWRAMERVVAKYKEAWVGFDPQELIENEENILVTDGNENYGLFEYHDDGVYYGHYLFTARGPQNTFRIARDLLGFFFKSFPVQTVLGLTPVEHEGAIRLNKLLGFTFGEVVDTEAGPHHQVHIHKEDFNYG